MSTSPDSLHYPETHHPGAGGDEPPVVLLHGGNVANWMWEPQVAALSDRTVLTPHLPGFGARVDEEWPGLDAAADDVVGRLDRLGAEGPVALVGLSLGAVVALHVLARHPGRVRSAMVTGAPLRRVGVGPRLASRLQLAAWDRAWFWKAQAAAFRLPPDSRTRYVDHGLSIRRDTAAGMLAEVYAGSAPAGLSRYDGPLLALAGEKEPAVARRSLRDIASAVPSAATRIAPGMHHIWNIEDVDLFNEVLRAWLAGAVGPRLRPAR